MVAKFYMHDAVSSDTGTLPGASPVVSGLTVDVTAAGASTNRAMNGTIGVLQQAPTLATVARTANQVNWFRRFLSPPLAAQSLSTISWTILVAGLTTNASNSAFVFSASLVLWRPSTGAVVGDWGAPGSATAMGASEKGGSMSFVAAAITASVGDILVLEIQGTVSQGMATSYTWTFDYDGTTDPVDNTAATSAASYLLASADVPLFVPSSFIARPNPNSLQAVNRAAYF